MKKAFVYSLLAVLTLVGCQAEQEELNHKNEITQKNTKVFTAIVEDDFNGGTKTSLDGSGNVLWKQGDQVSIFAGSTVNEHYQVSDASDGKTAASLNRVESSGFVAGTEIDNNVAFYPYASAAELAKNGDNYVISGIELPATQNYVEGSFGNGAFPMAAVTNSTEDMNLKFKNVLGGLKLQLKGTATITSITVKGNNDEILCGDAEVTMAYGGVPSVALSDASAKTVTLDCGAGVTLNSETATPFIIALPPMTMTGGFTVVVTDSESKQMEIKTIKTQTIPRSNLLKMPVVSYVGTAKPFTITSTGTTSVSINKLGTPYDIVLEYKKGDGEWTSYTIGNSIDLTDGQTLQFRAGVDGNETFSKTFYDEYNVDVTNSGRISVSGNIMSLLDRRMERVSVPQYAFCHLFLACSNISSASELILPATTLADYCYSGMFYNCAGLTSAPELPATILADFCYKDMFYNCAELTSAPELPATTLAVHCYSNMFSNCSGLSTAPELPATTLASSCYEGMFNGCTGLASSPVLPATTLASRCYMEMFYDCTGLISAPELPATTLAASCYNGMFYGCTALTSAPELPATSLADYCYSSMFYRCTGLTSAPELPATTLASRCYQQMFRSCTGLTSAPELPATSLAVECYAYMFYGCNSLNFIKMLATNISASNSLSNWVGGVAATGTFVKSSSASWNVIGPSGVPNGWTIQSYSPIPEVVDLGLSVKWASFNIGASAPEEYGDYFAWGEMTPKDMEAYNWSTYTLCADNSSSSLIKYNPNKTYGIVDYKNYLEPSDDVAHINLGDYWRIPTEEEWSELINQCTWEWTTIKNINGYRITSKKNGYTDKWIFLPAAGHREALDYSYEIGYYGYYWSSSLDSNRPYDARYMKIDTYSHYTSYWGRSAGLTIRPVMRIPVITTGVQLNKTYTSIKVFNSEPLTATILPNNATTKEVTWSSSNTDVAIVNSNGVITAIADGETIISATTIDGSEISASCSVTVSSTQMVVPIPDEIDLGLSVKWASFNVGASAPAEYGAYYAWGETSIKNNYGWNDYSLKAGGYNWDNVLFSKYITSKSYGTMDNKTVLDTEDDVAHVILGGNWRIPTNEEFEELINNCTRIWTMMNGVYGCRFTSNIEGHTDKWIFLPAAGNRYDMKLSRSNASTGTGSYWTSSLYTGQPNRAYRFTFANSYAYSGDASDRYLGYTIRPVCD